MKNGNPPKTKKPSMPNMSQRPDPFYNHDFGQFQLPSPSIDDAEEIQISQEAPWDKRGEDLLRDWLVTCKQQTAVHRKRGFKLKKLYKIFGVLSIFTAGLVFLLSNLSVSESALVDDTIHVIFAFINLIIANLVGFLNYGPKYQHQFEYEGKYTKVSIDIEELLVTDREYRNPKDRTLAEYKEKIGNLFMNAPEA